MFLSRLADRIGMKRNKQRLMMMVFFLVPLFGCQASVNFRDYESSPSVTSPVANQSSSEIPTVAREWIVTPSGARVGVSKSVMSETQILTTGAKVRMEVGHE